MDGIILKNDIIRMKERVDKIEEELNRQISELKIKEERWSQMDTIAEQIKLCENGIVKFNICGKKFMTKVTTLLNTKDTLFYKLITSREVDLDDEVFFDRDAKYFGIILDFLRSKKINLKRFTAVEKNDLRREAEYFEVMEILDELGEAPAELQIVKYEMNGNYSVGETVIGTNKLEDILETFGMGGICANSVGWIMFELNYQWNINLIDVAGYRGNSTYWACDHGVGASIKVSLDKTNWTTVGYIPSGFGSTIKTVNFNPTLARYIKFEHTTFLGIGFLRVKTEHPM